MIMITFNGLVHTHYHFTAVVPSSLCRCKSHQVLFMSTLPFPLKAAFVSVAVSASGAGRVSCGASFYATNPTLPTSLSGTFLLLKREGCRKAMLAVWANPGAGFASHSEHCFPAPSSKGKDVNQCLDFGFACPACLVGSPCNIQS